MTAPNAPRLPTHWAEIELQRYRLLLETQRSILDATQTQLERAVEENFRLRGELEVMRGKVK